MATDSDSTETLKPTWGRGVCAVVSVLIAWHVVAVMLGPMSLPPSILATTLKEKAFGRYLELAFLGHAYKFFAPDPGPSHLIRYELEMADGSRHTGTFPNLNEQWPRLLYHRYFMLTELVGNGPEDPSMIQVDWTKRPPTQWMAGLAKSYAEHLLHESGARRVTLTLVQHGLYHPDQIRAGAKLNDPSSYYERPLGTFVNEASL